MFSTFVGLGRFISCQRPDYTIGRKNWVLINFVCGAEAIAEGYEASDVSILKCKQHILQRMCCFIMSKYKKYRTKN